MQRDALQPLRDLRCSAPCGTSPPGRPHSPATTCVGRAAPAEEVDHAQLRRKAIEAINAVLGSGPPGCGRCLDPRDWYSRMHLDGKSPTKLMCARPQLQGLIARSMVTASIPSSRKPAQRPRQTSG